MSHTDTPYEPVFTGDRRAELDTIMSRYPTTQAALLPALWIAQNARGWLSDPAIEEVAQVLDLDKKIPDFSGLDRDMQYVALSKAVAELPASQKTLVGLAEGVWSAHHLKRFKKPADPAAPKKPADPNTPTPTRNPTVNTYVPPDE